MGRAGRAAPRTCSTLEIRPHASSLTVSLPATVSKPSPASPPSPSTPVQAPPANVTPPRQAWPQDVLQVVQLQLESLRSHSVLVNEPATRKRDFEASQSHVKVEQQPEVSTGLEVELHAQPALPEDWEQCLDLKTGQLYYFHWRTCKRARQDPRELIRRADECVQAHLLEAQARMAVSTDDNAEQASSHDDEPEVDSHAGRSTVDACAQTYGECSESGRCGRTETGNDGPMSTSRAQMKIETTVCGGATSREAVMVVLGCHSCAMIVMLCLSSPACPSCGASLHPDHDGIR